MTYKMEVIMMGIVAANYHPFTNFSAIWPYIWTDQLRCSLDILGQTLFVAFAIG